MFLMDTKAMKVETSRLLVKRTVFIRGQITGRGWPSVQEEGTYQSQLFENQLETVFKDLWRDLKQYFGRISTSFP